MPQPRLTVCNRVCSLSPNILNKSVTTHTHHAIIRCHIQTPSSGIIIISHRSKQQWAADSNSSYPCPYPAYYVLFSRCCTVAIHHWGGFFVVVVEDAWVSQTQMVPQQHRHRSSRNRPVRMLHAVVGHIHLFIFILPNIFPLIIC